jgi:hypothetical protein
VRGLGEDKGDAEVGAPGGGAGRPGGRLGFVGEGGVVVPAQDEGLQEHPAGEDAAGAGAGRGHGDDELRQIVGKLKKLVKCSCVATGHIVL